MKLAPWVGLTAIAAIAGAMAWADAPQCDCKNNSVGVPLDFAGVETLELHADSAHLTFVSGGMQPQLKHPADAPGRIERDGTTLRIRQSDPDTTLWVDAPSTLRRVVLPMGGHLDAEKAPVGALDVAVRGNLRWKGDARWLRILHGGPLGKCKDDEWDCKTDVTIWNGKIGMLVMRLPDGDMTLHNASGLERLKIELGPGATYGFINMDGSAPQVEVLAPGAAEDEVESLQAATPPAPAARVQAVPSAPASAGAVPAPAKPAAEPPRRP
jgi:hypothetical protein